MPALRNQNFCVINDDNFQPDQVIDTGITTNVIGQLWGIDVTSGNQGLYFIGKGMFTAIAASTWLSGTKNAPNKINFYFEDGTLKVQNKLDSTRYLYVKFEGLV